MPDNILFLMTDQHSVSTIGAYGNPIVRTPALDRLAASGTRFTGAFTPTAICTPARASLLTGAAPFRHKLLANYERNVGYLEDLADGQFTYPGALERAGWQLGLIGKWHGGVQRTAASYGFQGPTLNGWHNPVRGVTPNRSPDNLMAARPACVRADPSQRGRLAVAVPPRGDPSDSTLRRGGSRPHRQNYVGGYVSFVARSRVSAYEAAYPDQAATGFRTRYQRFAPTCPRHRTALSAVSVKSPNCSSCWVKPRS